MLCVSAVIQGQMAMRTRVTGCPCLVIAVRSRSDGRPSGSHCCNNSASARDHPVHYRPADLHRCLVILALHCISPIMSGAAFNGFHRRYPAISCNRSRVFIADVLHAQVTGHVIGYRTQRMSMKSVFSLSVLVPQHQDTQTGHRWHHGP